MPALGSFRTNSSVKVGDKRFIIERKLGSGAFGVVYKVREESSYRAYALKDVLCLDKWAINSALREVETMSRISHENVIAIKDSAKLRDDQGLHMLIVTKYCSGGNLNERLTRSSSEELNFKWIRQTAGALAFLHSQNVVHRDLKADNVLLTATEDAKLADFGLAREFMSVKQCPNFTAKYYMSSGVGPQDWLAPEFFRGHYTEKADVFSLGTLFYGILERDYITSRGKAYYGAFKYIPDEGKVGLGKAMAHYDSKIRIKFSRRAQGSYALQGIALDAMQYSKNDRPSATEIHNQIVSIGLQKSCQRSISSAPTKSFSDGELRTSTRHTFRRLTSKVSSPPPQSNFSPHPPVNKPTAVVARSHPTANRTPFHAACQTANNFSPPFCQTPNTFCPPFCQTPNTFCPPFQMWCPTPPVCQFPMMFFFPVFFQPQPFFRMF